MIDLGEISSDGSRYPSGRGSLLRRRLIACLLPVPQQRTLRWPWRGVGRTWQEPSVEMLPFRLIQIAEIGDFFFLGKHGSHQN